MGAKRVLCFSEASVAGAFAHTEIWQQVLCTRPETIESPVSLNWTSNFQLQFVSIGVRQIQIMHSS